MVEKYSIDVQHPLFRELFRDIAAGPDARRLPLVPPEDIRPAQAAPALADRPRVLRWGFHRYDASGLILCARGETACQRPMFRRPLAESRCLLPASRCCIWEDPSARKTRRILCHPHGRPLYMAGIYRIERGQPTPCFVILTREAPGQLQLPLLLAPSLHQLWLQGGMDLDEALAAAETDIPCLPIH